MKKCEYRCNRCFIIEERWIHSSQRAFNSVPCHKCGGLALRLPWSKFKENIFEDFDIFEDFEKKRDNLN